MVPPRAIKIMTYFVKHPYVFLNLLSTDLPMVTKILIYYKYGSLSSHLPYTCESFLIHWRNFGIFWPVTQQTTLIRYRFSHSHFSILYHIQSGPKKVWRLFCEVTWRRCFFQWELKFRSCKIGYIQTNYMSKIKSLSAMVFSAEENKNSTVLVRNETVRLGETQFSARVRL